MDGIGVRTAPRRKSSRQLVIHWHVELRGPNILIKTRLLQHMPGAGQPVLQPVGKIYCDRLLVAEIDLVGEFHYRKFNDHV